MPKSTSDNGRMADPTTDSFFFVAAFEMKCEYRYHLNLEDSAWAFCGAFPGPDAGLFNTAADGPAELLELAQAGAQCCSVCLLAAAKVFVGVRHDAEREAWERGESQPTLAKDATEGNLEDWVFEITQDVPAFSDAQIEILTRLFEHRLREVSRLS